MIHLPAKQVRAIAAGRTTQVRVIPGERRLVKRKDWERRGKSATYWTSPWVPRFNAEVQVLGHDSDTGLIEKSCRVVLTSHRMQGLAHITPADAKAEGHTSVDAAKAAWVRQHDKEWVERHKADWPNDCDATTAILARFDARWACRETWVVTVRVVARKTLLADVRKGRGDYTSSPAQTIDRGAEAVDEETQERFAKAALVTRLSTAEGFTRDLERERFDRVRVQADLAGLATDGARRIAENPATSPARISRQTEILSRQLAHIARLAA